MRSRAAAENDRTVASQDAVSGMMLRLVPPSMRPTVRTTGSKTSKRRVTIACSPDTISASAEIGSRVRCGEEPWPPAPRTVTCNASLAAISVPGRVLTVDGGNVDDITCSP